MDNRRWVLELGMVLALVASALWGLDEPVVSLPAVLSSTAWGLGIFSLWLLGWASAVHHDHNAEQRDRLRRLRRIDGDGRRSAEGRRRA
jgi:hypothetical protein